MDEGSPRGPLPDGFDPHSKNDGDGLSVYREKYHSAEEVAGFRTKGKKPTWVAKVLASSVAGIGLTLKPDPRESEDGLPPRPGHALIVEMNSLSRKSPEVDQWKRQLLARVIEVVGPFDPPST